MYVAPVAFASTVDDVHQNVTVQNECMFIVLLMKTMTSVPWKTYIEDVTNVSHLVPSIIELDRFDERSRLVVVDARFTAHLDAVGRPRHAYEQDD